VDTACPKCSTAVPAGARFCPSCGAALADRATEERKLVTVLFADITGSTTLGERFDPERWRVLLQRFFSVMTSTIEAWGGTVQKFMGDSVMATFGVPIVRGDGGARDGTAGHPSVDGLPRSPQGNAGRHGRPRTGSRVARQPLPRGDGCEKPAPGANLGAGGHRQEPPGAGVPQPGDRSPPRHD